MPRTARYDQEEFEAAVSYVVMRNPAMRNRSDAEECLRRTIERGAQSNNYWTRTGGFVVTFSRYPGSDIVDVGIFVQALFHGAGGRFDDRGIPPVREEPERRTAWERLKDENDPG